MFDFELPNVVGITQEGASASYKIGPIDAGYARSLASGLRRVLLSSLEGSAITALLIKDVQHQFQDIPHVKKDVIDIVQSLKKVRLRSFCRPVTLRLDVAGEGMVTAGDIRTPGTIEIVSSCGLSYRCPIKVIAWLPGGVRPDTVNLSINLAHANRHACVDGGLPRRDPCVRFVACCQSPLSSSENTFSLWVVRLRHMTLSQYWRKPHPPSLSGYCWRMHSEWKCACLISKKPMYYV